ncbi:uncharacterized protein A1O5_07291 [Cladophialophora psammophila CBS 110553]|uniref:Uncharacterized protein n=1 Tax=Cladophialophora psammophila CBS 110553 TaxID=1182543 RepID=W9WW09_9EURO|nr:uncharacterized protein A1O5_07291 [Cladophialophora psammophila CBS 110553]EXJ69255.1 hypothetical protein A1O5_07291 [Cladophialophora psammophila CBS 110553]
MLVQCFDKPIDSEASAIVEPLHLVAQHRVRSTRGVEEKAVYLTRDDKDLMAWKLAYLPVDDIIRLPLHHDLLHSEGPVPKDFGTGRHSYLPWEFAGGADQDP